MWIFGKMREHKRLRALEEDMETFRTALRGMRADMDLQWEKVQRGLGRIAKRSAIIEAANQEEEPDDAAAPEGSFDPETTAAFGLEGLTKRQIEIQRRIVQARRRA